MGKIRNSDLNSPHSLNLYQPSHHAEEIFARSHIGCGNKLYEEHCRLAKKSPKRQ
jgi:hypothetical protein